MHSILEEAQDLVTGDRNNSYGPAWQDYERTAKFWSLILGTEVSSRQAALCMAAVKLSRECHKHKRDNLVDMAGYAHVAQIIAEHAEEYEEKHEKSTNIVYLASPYSHTSKKVRAKRYSQVLALTAKLIKQGIVVYSPIVHSHNLGLNGDWEYWQEHDKQMLSVCSKLYVAKIPGFEKSIGVREEIKEARKKGIPVSFLYPKELEAPNVKIV